MSSSTTPPPPRGMPILSGPPPIVESSTCRQCSESFNPIWRRGKTCGHCGYEYCSTCLNDGQALMPRKAKPPSTGTEGLWSEVRDAFSMRDDPPTPGWEVEPVCLQCLGMLQVTSAPLETLRSLPLKRLKEYLKAYDIKAIGVTEKDDLVQAALKARNPATGCLRPEHESYYRRRSVLKQGRPVQPQQQQQQPYPERYPPNQHSHRPPPPTYATRQPRAQARPPPPQPQAAPRPQAAPQAARPPPPRAAPAPAPTSSGSSARPAASAKARPTPPPPVPTILSLVALPKSYLASLSIGTLKAILYENHVRVDFKQVLEKEELINRVYELVAEERRRLERQRVAEENEERELAEARAAAAARKAAAEQQLATESEAAVNGAEPSSNGEGSGSGSPAEGTPDEQPVAAALDVDDSTKLPPPPTSPLPAASRPPPTGPQPDLDRGLCIVCQDQEATLAVVDCGHLAMCQDCSDLIMATSKECPLCRTRIVTPQRLIRIYRP